MHCRTAHFCVNVLVQLSVPIFTIIVCVLIIESPLAQNPVIENPNASSILLKWSPPYLWPGSSIDYYIISISGTTKTYHLVNASFDDTIATFLETADNPDGIQSCNKLTFSVSAVTHRNSCKLASFTVIGGYLPRM